MIGGMRLGIWVYRLQISLFWVFFGTYGKGCLGCFVFMGVKLILICSRSCTIEIDGHIRSQVGFLCFALDWVKIFPNIQGSV